MEQKPVEPKPKRAYYKPRKPPPGPSLEDRLVRTVGLDQAREIGERILKNLTREELTEVSLYYPDARFTELALKLMDARFAKTNLYALLRWCKLGPIELLEACRRYKLDESLLRVMKGLPETAQGTVEDSQPSLVNCSRCDGQGWVPERNEQKEPIQRVCPECDGQRKVRRAGDKDSKKLIFEAGGLINNSPTVAIQQNFNSGFKSFDQVVREGMDD